MRCPVYAREHGFDALVFLIDQDDDPGRRQPLDRAQEYVRVALSRAFGLAVQKFDAWMVAAERALSRSLGRNIQRQPDPEDIRNPKARCKQLRADHEISLTALYMAITREAAIETIEQRCPRGFGVFAERLRRL